MGVKFTDIFEALSSYGDSGKIPELNDLSVEQVVYLEHIITALPPALYSNLRDQIEVFIQDEYRLKYLKDGDQRRQQYQRIENLTQELASKDQLRPMMDVIEPYRVASYVVADLAQLARVSE